MEIKRRVKEKQSTEDKGEKARQRHLRGDELNSIWISSPLWSSWITVISFSPLRLVQTEKYRDREKALSTPFPIYLFAMCDPRMPTERERVVDCVRSCLHL